MQQRGGLFISVPPLSVGAALAALAAGDERLADALTEAVLCFPSPAVFFEVPPVTRATAGSRRFEFVLLPSDGLAGATPDATAFGDVFAAAEPGAAVAVFTSLGGDATLVAPLPAVTAPGQRLAGAGFGHLKSFLETAPEAQRRAAWRAVASQALRVLRGGAGDGAPEHGQPLWLSTSGLGVSWLHFRLDSVPKYYNTVAYKTCC